MNYFVVQEIGGQLYIHGPYKSSDARDHRYEVVKGGEVYRFNSYEAEPEKVKQEFLDEKVRGL